MRLLGAANTDYHGEGDASASTILYGSGATHKVARGFSRIRRSVYPGIEWVWEGQHGSLDFQFEVSPGGDPAAIRLAFDGHRGLQVGRGGSLEIAGDVDLRFGPPEAWQEQDGIRAPVAVAFRIDSGAVTFEVGAHNPELPLKIAPSLQPNAAIAGAGYDAVYAAVTDVAGNVYVTGETSSVDFKSSKGVRLNRDAFVSKLSPQTGQVEYTVILASSGNDAGRALAVDGSGNVWVAGVAGGVGFPVTSGALGSAPLGAGEAFLVRLSSNGALSYGSLLGGSGPDAATGVSIDTAGAVYISGYTSSVDFPAASNAPQRAFRGGTDAFLVKISPGASIVYSTLLGGSGNDLANGVAVDPAGNACIAGRTDTPNLTLVKPAQNAYGGSGDALIACLNAGGTAWNSVTYLGGSAPDQAKAIALDNAGNLYLAGETFMVAIASAGSYESFIAKLNASAALVFFTVIGGSGDDAANSVLVSPAGTLWIAGQTTSVDFPATRGAAFAGQIDAFTTQISADGKSLLLSMLLGGAGDDRAFAVATDGKSVYVAGQTSSRDFPSAPSTAASSNGFVYPIMLSNPPSFVSLTPAAATGPNVSFTITVTDPDGGKDVSYVQFAAADYLGAPSCQVYADLRANWIWLLNDNGTAWLGPVTAGGAIPVSNSRCSVDASRSSFMTSGTTATVTLRMTAGALTGAKQVFVSAGDSAGLAMAWTKGGAWTNGGAPTDPAVTPSASTRASETFAIQVSDPNGAADVQYFEFAITDYLGAAARCQIYADAQTNWIWLLNDSNSSWLGPVAAGSATVLSNSRCSLVAAQSGFSRAGNIATMNLRLDFASSFTGAKQVFVAAGDLGRMALPWTKSATWTGGAKQAPQNPLLSPASSSSSKQLYTIQVADPDGAQDISFVQLAFTDYLGSTASCQIYADARANWIWLLNDNNSSWLGPAAAGSANVLSNSRCSVAAAQSSFGAAGTIASITLSITFPPSFTGTKQIYVTGGDIGGLPMAWTKVGQAMLP